jgi:ubiquinone/menaquinone biosynthesis C-methylase UbiE
MASGFWGFVTTTLSLVGGTVLGSQSAARIQSVVEPFPFPHQLSPLLESRFRMWYRDPAEAIGLFGIGPAMSVLDLGSGTGLFSEEMARAVGAAGHVHAVEIQQPLVDRTRRRVNLSGFGDRVTCYRAGAYSLPLESQSIDVAVLVATLGEIPEKLRALLELFRVTKPGGRLAISEEVMHTAYVVGPGVRNLAEEAGFRFVAKTGGPLCFTMVFTRP